MEDCKRCKEAEAIIQTWTDKQGHERCWYYPDLFKRLALLFNIAPKLPPNLPPRSEFEEGCRRYQDDEFNVR